MDKAQLLKLYREKPASEIAKDHNLRPSQIQNLLRIYEIPKPYRNKEGKALNIKHIYNLHHTQNMSIKDISSSLNASIDMITNILHKDKTISLEDLQSCLNLSKKEIALKYQTQEDLITELMVQHNIEPNPFSISKEDLQKEYESLSIFQISKKYQIDKVYVSLKLKEYGLLIKSNLDDLKRLYCVERKTLKEIISELKISETTLWRLIKKHKLKRPFNPNPKEFSKMWYNRKITQEENIKLMSNFYKVSVGIIRLTAKKLNLIKKVNTIKIDPVKLKELYDKHDIFGLSVIFKIKESDVKLLLSKHGVQIKNRKKDFDLSLVSNLYKTKYLNLKNKYAIEEIAKELNVKPTPLYQFIRLHKVTR